MGAAPFLKLAEKSCFLTCPTEWKWRKTGRSLGVEVAADKTNQEPKIISFSLHLVIFTFPVPWAAFQRKGQAVLPWAKSEGRVTQETKQEGWTGGTEWLEWKSAMCTHRPRRLGHCGKASWDPVDRFTASTWHRWSRMDGRTLEADLYKSCESCREQELG